MVVRIDATKIINAGIKLYPALLYSLCVVVNRREEFRTAFNSAGELGVYERMHPSYTVKAKDKEYFSVLWTEFTENYAEFERRIQEDCSAYAGMGKLNPKEGMPENVFSASMIPWIEFEGFNLNLPKAGDYLLPIFTFGKFGKEGARTTLPMSIQVHHAVCDAYHVYRFIDELQKEIDLIPEKKFGAESSPG